MSPRAKWFEDLGRNRARRVSRTDLDAGAPFTLFEEHVADPAEGPETARTEAHVDTLLRGLDVMPETYQPGRPIATEAVDWPMRAGDAPQVSCNVAHFNGDGTPAPCPGFEHGLGHVEQAPKARENDPETSKAAARAARPGGLECIAEIRSIVGAAGPMTPDEIARAVLRKWPRRWAVATIKTRISQADLCVFDHDGVSERGQSCRRFVLESA